MGVVYFISDGEYIKIGQTSNLPSRLTNLQCANARTLIVVHTIECADSGYMSMLENKLHSHFKKQRAMGEWFRLNWELVRLEVQELHLSLTNDIEKHNAEMEASRGWWKQRELQSRFDKLVDKDIEENFPPKRRFGRPLFAQVESKPYVSRFAALNAKSLSQQEKEERRSRFNFNPTNEDGTPRKSRFGNPVVK